MLHTGDCPFTIDVKNVDRKNKSVKNRDFTKEINNVKNVEYKTLLTN